MTADELVYEAQAEEAEELEPDATVDPDQDHTNAHGNGDGGEANEGEGNPIGADDELGIQHSDEEEEELVGEEEGADNAEGEAGARAGPESTVEGETEEKEVEISPPKRARSVSVHLEDESVAGKRVKIDGGRSLSWSVSNIANDAESE